MRTRFHTTFDSLGACVRIEGDLDLTTTPALHDELTAVRATGSTRVELDLDEITFVDAHSLRLLDQEQRRLRDLGGELRVASASASFALISAVAGYADLLPETDDVPDLRSLAEAALPVPGGARGD